MVHRIGVRTIYNCCVGCAFVPAVRIYVAKFMASLALLYAILMQQYDARCFLVVHVSFVTYVRLECSTVEVEQR